MYFLLAGLTGRFRYLNLGLGFILGFVGVKMLVSEVYHAPTWLSLAVIATALAVSITASLRSERRDLAAAAAAAAEE